MGLEQGGVRGGHATGLNYQVPICLEKRKHSQLDFRFGKDSQKDKR